MIKVYRETPEGHGSKGLKRVLQILEYQRGSLCSAYQEKWTKGTLPYTVSISVSCVQLLVTPWTVTHQAP